MNHGILHHDPAGPGTLQRDLLCLGLLLAMTGVLVGAYVPAVGFSPHEQCTNEVLAQMASYWLLPAMGFMLALRAGVVDASVWMSFSLGAVVAASLMGRGLWPGAAMAAGAGAGLAFGAVNALLVGSSRLPSALVTIITAVGLMLLLRWAMPHHAVPVPETAFDNWHLLGLTMSVEPGIVAQNSQPLCLTRMLLVASIYAVTLLTLLVLSTRAPDGPTPRRLRRWSLIVSGMLAAAGGALCLLDNPGATVPSRPIEDLRVPAAALLAGGLLLQGRQRALLACVCLPPAMLLTTVWRQMVWDLDYQGYSLSLLILLGGTVVMALAGRALTAQASLAQAGAALPAPSQGGHRSRGRWLLAAAVLAGAGLLILSASAGVAAPRALTVLHVLGTAVLIAGAGLYALANNKKQPATEITG